MDNNQRDPPFHVGQSVTGRQGTNIGRFGEVTAVRQLNGDSSRSGRGKYEFTIAWEASGKRPAELEIVQSIKSLWPRNPEIKNQDDSSQDTEESCCEVEAEEIAEDENDSIDLENIMNADDVDLKVFEENDNEALAVTESVANVPEKKKRAKKKKTAEEMLSPHGQIWTPVVPKMKTILTVPLLMASDLV